jgi:hypothetical protein
MEHELRRHASSTCDISVSSTHAIKLLNPTHNNGETEFGQKELLSRQWSHLRRIGWWWEAGGVILSYLHLLHHHHPTSCEQQATETMDYTHQAKLASSSLLNHGQISSTCPRCRMLITTKVALL